MGECPRPDVLTAHAQADTFSYGVVLWELITKEQTERGNWRDVVVPDECPAGVEVLLKVGWALLLRKSRAQLRSGSGTRKGLGLRYRARLKRRTNATPSSCGVAHRVSGSVQLSLTRCLQVGAGIDHSHDVV